MSKLNFIILTDSDKEHRLKRFQEECEKRDISTTVFNMCEIVLGDDGIYSKAGERLEMSFENSIIWVISNMAVGHYVSKSLRFANVKVWPDGDASEFSDKFFANSFFSQIGIPTPKTALLSSYDFSTPLKIIGGLPCIIKKTSGSVGRFVEMVHTEDEIKKFIIDTFEWAKEGKIPMKKMNFIVQELIKETKGVDYRVLCLDGEVLGVIKREAQKGFKSNVSLGGKATAVPIDEKLKEYALKIMKEGNLFYAGIDFMKVGDDYTALEVNTSAQFKGFEAATGINVAEKIIEKLIEKRLN